MTLRVDTARPLTIGHQGPVQPPGSLTPAPRDTVRIGRRPRHPRRSRLHLMWHPPLDADAAAALARQTSERIARQGQDAVRAQAGLSPDVVLRLLQD